MTDRELRQGAQQGAPDAGSTAATADGAMPSAATSADGAMPSAAPADGAMPTAAQADGAMPTRAAENEGDERQH